METTMGFLLWLFICLFLRAQGKGPRWPDIIVFTHDDVRRISVVNDSSSYESKILVGGLDLGNVGDVLVKKNSVFWADSKDKIFGTDLTNIQNKTAIVDTVSPAFDSLAVDWINDKLYWIADSETVRIEVSELDGSKQKALLYNNFEQPKSLAVDPISRYLFWIDSQDGNSVIERAGMDGRKRSTLITRLVGHASCLTVDHKKGQLFWTDASQQGIYSSTINGLNIHVIISELNSPLSITVAADHIFWTDSTHIKSCTVEDCVSNVQSFEYRDMSISVPRIRVFSHHNQIKGINYCAGHGSVCSDLCLLSPIEPFWFCACPTGIKLLSDNHSCSKGPEKLLLIARKKDISKISLDTADYSDMIVSLSLVRQAIGIDYDPVEKYMYWTDNELNYISRAHLDGSNLERVPNSEFHQSDGVAIDFLSRQIYWTDSGLDRIEVARLDGKARRVLISTGLKEPRAIVLDPVGGFMYWSDWGHHPKIEKAYLDGSNRQTLVDFKSEYWPNGLALDISAGRIYWCDGKHKQIESARLTDGLDRRVLITEDIRHPYGLTLLGDYLYWTELESRYVKRVNKRNATDRMDVRELLPDMMGIKAVDTSLNFDGLTNACSRVNGGCSHLCFHRPVGKICSCPVGMELSKDQMTCTVQEAYLIFTAQSIGDICRISLKNGSKMEKLNLHNASQPMKVDYDVNTRKVYWSDSIKLSISRAFLNGTGEEVIVNSGIIDVESLAVDWVSKNLYWSDATLGRIEVVLIANPLMRRVIVWRDCYARGIAVNPYSGHLYWCNWGAMANSIDRTSLDGSNRESIVTDITRPNTLSLDLKNRRMYWVDEYHVASADLNGGRKRFHEPSSNSQPMAQTLYGNNLYFVDNSVQGSIFHLQADNLSNQSVLHERVTDNQIFELKAVQFHAQTGLNQCAVKNGDCTHLCFVVPNSEYISDGFSASHPATIKQCSCPTHFDLDKHDKCKPPNNFILYSMPKEIYRLKTDSISSIEIFDNEPVFIFPYKSLSKVNSLAYDPLERVIYWLDMKQKVIKRAADEDSCVDEIRLRTNNAVAMAIDPYRRLLIWSSLESNSINISRIGPVSIPVEDLGSIVSGPNVIPKALAVYSIKNLLFFVNASGTPSITRCRLDGRECLTIVQNVNPSELAVDSEFEYLFWSDLGFSGETPENSAKIIRSSFDGLGQVVLVKNIYPPIAMTIYRDRLLWTDGHGGNIVSVEKGSGQNLRQFSVIGTRRRLTGLFAVDELATNMVKSVSACTRARCSHICLLVESSVNSETLSHTCACPERMVIDPADNTKCLPAVSCPKHQFLCAKSRRQCINASLICNGQIDCADLSDESSCESCFKKDNNWKCLTSGECIPIIQYCNGKPDCVDGSDEKYCRCANPSAQFDCRKGGTDVCIMRDWLCNSVDDCDDGRDESICSQSKLTMKTTDGGLSDNTASHTVIIFVVVLAITGCVACCTIFIVRRLKPKPPPTQGHREFQLNVSVAGGSNNVSTSLVPPRQLHPHCTSVETPLISGVSVDFCPRPLEAYFFDPRGYDRPNLTGKSSSSSCNAMGKNNPNDFYRGGTVNLQNPPPSPVTADSLSIADEDEEEFEEIFQAESFSDQRRSVSGATGRKTSSRKENQLGTGSERRQSRRGRNRRRNPGRSHGVSNRRANFEPPPPYSQVVAGSSAVHRSNDHFTSSETGSEEVVNYLNSVRRSKKAPGVLPPPPSPTAATELESVHSGYAPNFALRQPQNSPATERSYRVARHRPHNNPPPSPNNGSSDS